MADGWLGVHRRVGDRPDFIKFPWSFACPVQYCYMYVSAKTEADAENIRDTHDCPHSGVTHFSGEITMTLVHKMWATADLVMDELVASMALQETEPTDERKEDILKAQGKLRGICLCLAIFMIPHFTTEEEIAKEIRIRYRHRSKAEDYETKGLGSRRYELPRSEDEKPKVGSPERPRITLPPAPPKATKHSLGEMEIKAIKFAADSGMFSNADLAKTYKVSEAVIGQVVSS